MSCIVCCQNVERFDQIDSLLTSRGRICAVPAVNILQSLSVARKHSPLVQGASQGKNHGPYLGGTGLVYKKGWPSNTTRGSDLEKGVICTQAPCRQLMLLKSSIDRIWCTCGNGGRYTTAHKTLPEASSSLRAADPSMRTILDTTICSPSRKAKPAVSLLQCPACRFCSSIYNGTFYCILIIFFTSNVCMA
jgi:hypothetical protein